MTYEEWSATLIPFESRAMTRKEIFAAGAASRDAEIAELNRRIDYWRDTARKYLVPETKVRKP